ncbi:hypothetical protein EHQ76_10595 [Leptospira barantonii]|uniref:Lipoprotein n=1 Tax=Leptospira barantonii TaxID=2023184 RepID=A0A5F2B6H5_9LEPT|nr:hypothetical protein [Leptospira barantonii]TGM01082.1 hypothetical protein EHQ76_10595 [Leptospira barantonii]
MKIKSLTLFTVFFIFAGCTTVYLRNEEPIKTKVPRIDAKVAYVGFYPYRYTEEKGYVIDYTRRTIPNFRFGNFAADYEAEAVRADIPKETVEKFVNTYLKEAGSSAFNEIFNICKVEMKDNRFTFQLKDIPVDYLVTGVHAPTAKSRNAFYGILSFLSSTVSFFSLGFIPTYKAYEGETTIRIYDRNLNQIVEKRFENSFSVLSTIWLAGNKNSCKGPNCLFFQTTPHFVYELNGPEIENYFLEKTSTLTRGLSQ